ncbi:hypothetical protein RMSM_00248 [Rhodopirellula maiorica SM1]|uniref:Uncharacterized protein n=1 Tax=Rhodopirellula maiorica SM1 TaxID=1265738 RepID=M5S9H8_9BACT|nr:hypothetical protein [Rhodopirellula maiorica]EMI22824.1 hypothetical protein RMSM_00248 [Rhodopirellula maiorica SM1]
MSSKKRIELDQLAVTNCHLQNIFIAFCGKTMYPFRMANIHFTKLVVFTVLIFFLALALTFAFNTEQSINATKQTNEYGLVEFDRDGHRYLSMIRGSSREYVVNVLESGKETWFPMWLNILDGAIIQLTDSYILIVSYTKEDSQSVGQLTSTSVVDLFDRAVLFERPSLLVSTRTGSRDKIVYLDRARMISCSIADPCEGVRVGSIEIKSLDAISVGRASEISAIGCEWATDSPLRQSKTQCKDNSNLLCFVPSEKPISLLSKFCESYTAKLSEKIDWY